MRLRTFGRLGWRVSEIGYGMWGMAGWTGSDDAESRQALDRAVELGCNFFDTAYAYGDGKSERLLRDALARHRGTRLYAATKVPPRNRRWPGRAETPIADVFPYDYVVQMTHESRRNLGVERFTPDKLRKTLDHVDRLRPLVPAGGSLPNLALRFILYHPAVSTTIPGMRRVRHVEANLAASEAPPLTSEMIAALRAHRWDRDWPIP